MWRIDDHLQKRANISGAMMGPFTGLACDSRQVTDGALFFAVPGHTTDGADYVEEAAQRGAVAVMTEKPLQSPLPQLITTNVRRALALCAADYYAPPAPLTCVAVTGTNGKTSVAHFCYQLWAAMGLPAASIGTMGVFSTTDHTEHASLTTPDPITLHRVLHDLSSSGVQYVALEASSHGLSQYRLDGLDVQAAAWTNLTQDHLDYHNTMEAYAAAKLRLFDTLLARGKTAVWHASVDRWLSRTAHDRSFRTMILGQDLIIQALPISKGINMQLSYKGHTAHVILPLYGAFQADNVALAVGLLLGCGHEMPEICKALPALTGVRGRMECVHHGAITVFIDYAHTPDALAHALTHLRPHVTGAMHVVFGCGGNRDQGKRPLMGDVARRLADSVIITDDNPRNENPAKIRAAIAATCPEAQNIGDRRRAIDAALSRAQSGDAVLLAGKGHETGQIIGDRVIPFSDHAVVDQWLQAHQP